MTYEAGDLIGAAALGAVVTSVVLVAAWYITTPVPAMAKPVDITEYRVRLRVDEAKGDRFKRFKCVEEKTNG